MAMEDLGLYSGAEMDALLAQDGMECVSCEEGVLIDNLLLYNTVSEKYYMCTEQYQNEWSSCYKVIVGDSEVSDKWYDTFYYYTDWLKNNGYTVILKVVREKYNLNPCDIEHIIDFIQTSDRVINWFNFAIGDALYDDDGVECAECTEVDNVNKVITFTQDNLPD